MIPATDGKPASWSRPPSRACAVRTPCRRDARVSTKAECKPASERSLNQRKARVRRLRPAQACKTVRGWLGGSHRAGNFGCAAKSARPQARQPCADAGAAGCRHHRAAILQPQVSSLRGVPPPIFFSQFCTLKPCRRCWTRASRPASATPPGRTCETRPTPGRRSC